MKALKHSLSLFAFMLIIFCCNQSFAQDGLIIVQDYPANLGEPEIDLESHKTGDVEIHRVNYLNDEQYVFVDGNDNSGKKINEGNEEYEGDEIIYYHDISGKIRDYHFILIDTTNYDQGFYNWKNDTTVTVKVYGSETKKEFNVQFSPSRDIHVSGSATLLD
jgi:hypothetical protein